MLFGSPIPPQNWNTPLDIPEILKGEQKKPEENQPTGRTRRFAGPGDSWLLTSPNGMGLSENWVNIPNEI